MLDRACAAYEFDAALRAAVDAYVAALRRAGESADEVIDSVSTSVRVIRPTCGISGDGGWERTWRAYFALYDAVIQRAIRSFVVGGLKDDMRAAHAAVE